MTDVLQKERVTIHAAAHLSGGLRANLSDPMAMKVFPTTTGQPHIIPLTCPYDILEVLNSLGLVILGTEEFFDIGCLENRIWHPEAYRKLSSPGLSLAPPELWGALACAAKSAGDDQAASVMLHISFTLTAMGRRLMHVSDDYGMQLKAALENGTEHDTRFSNTQLLDLYLNCHSFLTEACTARDYLAQFLARHVYGGIEADSMAKLLRRKKLAHPLDALLNSANDKTNPGSWMLQMSEYRNIIMHRAPLSYLDGSRQTMLEIRFQSLLEGERLARVLALIPADPFNVSSGALVDALVILHAYTAHTLHFAAECARYSPYAPSIPRLDKSNVLSVQQL